jgi:hypothetical protein
VSRKSTEQIKGILRQRFDAESKHLASMSDKAASALFARLAETTSQIPSALADAYSELCSDMDSAEIEVEMVRTIDEWQPEDATAFVKKFISLATGGR